MYTEQDFNEINGKIRKNWLVLVPALVVLLGVYVFAFKARVRWLAMVTGPLLFVAACYGILAYLWPNGRYKGFLEDMRGGLSRELRGTIVEISEAVELQDGARVVPVRVKLAPEAVREQAVGTSSTMARRLSLESEEDTEDERIVYLNASKREGFPGPGSMVRLSCFGRHIKEVEAL